MSEGLFELDDIEKALAAQRQEVLNRLAENRGKRLAINMAIAADVAKLDNIDRMLRPKRTRRPSSESAPSARAVRRRGSTS